MDISHILNELGEDRSLYFNAVAPPIVQTSNFVFDSFEEIRKAFEDEDSAFLYSRGKNPTIEILRKKLAALDGAEDALVFNSGASAIFAAVLANVGAGDHIVSVDKPYSWAWRMFDNMLPRFHVKTTYVDGTRIENFEKALTPETRIIYLESPNSNTFELQDLEAVAKLARERGILTIIDNSYSTPLHQKPHAFGIDLSLQSATKYLGGHSDTVAGVLTGKKAMLNKIFNEQLLNNGSGISPFNAWLILRGIRTLQLRLEHISATTVKVIEFLKNHSKIERVIFPFDDDFPQISLAKKQMTGACGLFTIVLKAVSHEQIERFTYSLKHFLVAVSWGGHESLILPQAAGMAPGQFDPSVEKHRMARVYVGLENAEYLIRDLDQALSVL
ncbi:trans-sulfuration enzyme family protein [Dyadobacter sediminis]|uniref:Aminotransferase class I/II-fold pyridoxal phosphate-dependent enzyme n=1 Tax=Dyadobacter sediminis TaxID=1493691 RepID=A0A5R9KEG3_9BACT|nr:aminotransferase class I/II-fold pyridoxal phosphate-dependent enzyme [Dyadobacter sediminis]TLU94522.1 aminotransferase class I/II-fold pyridoxal phosphate-dependent enzyme [Dyadobacter sediminis]GGB90524.1 cystathionine gamma-synthase [Dyadobacter sediminis]